MATAIFDKSQIFSDLLMISATPGEFFASAPFDPCYIGVTGGFMKLFLGILLFSSIAMAESATYQVKGMDCGSCVKMIEDKVCKMEGVKTCKAEVVDSKNKIGKLTLSMEDGKAIDSKKVSELVTSAGHYSVETSAPQSKKSK